MIDLGQASNQEGYVSERHTTDAQKKRMQEAAAAIKAKLSDSVGDVRVDDWGRYGNAQIIVELCGEIEHGYFQCETNLRSITPQIKHVLEGIDDVHLDRYAGGIENPPMEYDRSGEEKRPVGRAFAYTLVHIET